MDGKVALRALCALLVLEGKTIASGRTPTFLPVSKTDSSLPTSPVPVGRWPLPSSSASRSPIVKSLSSLSESSSSSAAKGLRFLRGLDVSVDSPFSAFSAFFFEWRARRAAS